MVAEAVARGTPQRRMPKQSHLINEAFFCLPAGLLLSRIQMRAAGAAHRGCERRANVVYDNRLCASEATLVARSHTHYQIK